ncbi:MAG TPA: LysR family transcriptional regulator [Steroidobacteraceae bacterium]|jgi:DNA-binding transcriptional LysR family regulator|nr:LysR family transcriptional regulator [Steroidobacteraceae bacterium]
MSELWTAAQLAVFARVVELNGFSAAARAYRVPKVAISRAIADLEKSVGVQLMKRTTRRIFLTAAGEAVLPHARAIGVEVEKVRQLAQTFSTSREGPLRVIADPTYGRVLLAPLVPRFLDSFPDIALDVVLDSDEAGEWDVAIRAGQNDDPKLGARLLGAPPAVLCATPAYLQKHPAPDRPEGLREHALLTPASEGAEYRFQMTKASARAEVRVRPKLAVDDPAVLHSATVAGLGIGLLPEFLCRQGVATAKLRKVLADWQPPAAAPLYAVFPAGLEDDPRVRSFVEFAAANIVPALAH